MFLERNGKERPKTSLPDLTGGLGARTQFVCGPREVRLGLGATTQQGDAVLVTNISRSAGLRGRSILCSQEVERLEHLVWPRGRECLPYLRKLALLQGIASCRIIMHLLKGSSSLRNLALLTYSLFYSIFLLFFFWLSFLFSPPLLFSFFLYSPLSSFCLSFCLCLQERKERVREKGFSCSCWEQTGEEDLVDQRLGWVNRCQNPTLWGLRGVRLGVGIMADKEVWCLLRTTSTSTSMGLRDQSIWCGPGVESN